MNEKKLSIGIKITDVNASHTWFRQYANLIPVEQAHTHATRAGLGEAQCLRSEEFMLWMERLQPDVFTLAYAVTSGNVRIHTKVILLPLGHEAHWYMATEDDI